MLLSHHLEEIGSNLQPISHLATVLSYSISFMSFTAVLEDLSVEEGTRRLTAMYALIPLCFSMLKVFLEWLLLDSCPALPNTCV